MPLFAILINMLLEWFLCCGVRMLRKNLYGLTQISTVYLARYTHLLSRLIEAFCSVSTFHNATPGSQRMAVVVLIGLFLTNHGVMPHGKDIEYWRITMLPKVYQLRVSLESSLEIPQGLYRCILCRLLGRRPRPRANYHATSVLRVLVEMLNETSQEVIRRIPNTHSALCT